MSEIKLIIDDQETAVAPGTTILEAARELGLDIPTFCQDPELAPNGACRICVVEVQNGRSLVASCVTPVSAGMVVFTESERVVKARKSILSLLIANHPLVCITCEKTGSCKLQDYCYRYGIANSDYSGEVKELNLDDSNAFFVRDMNKCILCGICVGKCQEVVGAGAIDFTKRGFISNVGPAFEDAIENSTCVFCGLCIDSCPVGALIPKKSMGQGRPWQIEMVQAVCPYCSVGCNINLHVRAGKIIDVSAHKENLVNRGHLCVRGKFGWDYLESEQRLTRPLVKSGGVFVGVSWEEALALIVDQMGETIKRYGPGALMGLCSPGVSNEESYLFQKLVRSLGSNNIDSFSRHFYGSAATGLLKSYGSAALTNSIEEIAHTEALLIIETNPLESHPVLGYRVREAKAKGAEIVVAATSPEELADIANQLLQIRPGGILAFINAMAKVVIEENIYDNAFVEKRTQGFAAFKEALTGYSLPQLADMAGVEVEMIRTAARTYALADRAAIISSPYNGHQFGDKLILALANLALLCGNLGREFCGLYLPPCENNFQGITDMGVMPGLLSGYQAIEEKSIRDRFSMEWGSALNDKPGITALEALSAGSSSPIEALFIIGENLLDCSADRQLASDFLTGVDFLVVQDTFMTETASLADIVLPAAAFAEQVGTYTNAERRVQLSQQALQPPGEAYAGWAILAELAGWLGLQWNYAGPEAIFAEIASLNPHYGGLSYPRLQNQGLQWPCSGSDHPGTRYLHEGRFIRGLGLFTAVDNELSAHSGEQAIFNCRDSRYPDFKGRDSIRERHSLISNLSK